MGFIAKSVLNSSFKNVSTQTAKVYLLLSYWTKSYDYDRINYEIRHNESDL